jgi:hypothetical protein
MSENNKKATIYVPGVQIKEHKFDDGSVLNVGINLEKFAPFVKTNKNERNYINLRISKRKTVGEFGDTHSIYLNTWTPPKNEDGTTTSKPKTTSKSAPKKSQPEPEEQFI